VSAAAPAERRRKSRRSTRKTLAAAQLDHAVAFDGYRPDELISIIEQLA